MLSTRLYSLVTAGPFKPEDVGVVGPTQSFCYHCLDPIYMPFRCHRCGGFFFGTHRLPERHDCTGGEGGR